MNHYEAVQSQLRNAPKVWLVTGAAGFIGSHLVTQLLGLDQTVVGLDNFATGHKHNLDEALAPATQQQLARFKFIEGDIRNLEICQHAVAGADYVLHQAALGSVPRSVADPFTSHDVNVTGTVNMLIAARDQKVARFVFASSSSVYGDDPGLPKIEDRTGNLLSPYAVTKRICEEYAQVFSRVYDIQTIGLRYFNVFGPRQDPDGPYAAVIPRWVAAMRQNRPAFINLNPAVGSKARPAHLD